MSIQLEETIEKRESSIKVEKCDSHSYDDVLKLIGNGCAQWMVLFAVGLLLMLVINETAGMAFIAISSRCDFATDTAEKAWISSSSFLGILVSSYFWGYMSDRAGRRVVLLNSTFVAVVISLISTFIPYFWLYIVARFFVGFFLAGASSTTYAYLGEFFLPHQRPLVVNASSIFVGLSNLYVPAISWVVLLMDWSIPMGPVLTLRPWRLLIFFNALPGIIGVTLIWLLPESPKLLLSRNRTKEAYEAFDWICQTNTGKQLSELKVSKISLPEADCHKVVEHEILTSKKTFLGLLKEVWQDTAPLFQRPHVLNFLLCCIVSFGLILNCSGMGVYYPEILNRVGEEDAHHHQTVCQIIDNSNIKTADQNATSSIICDDSISTKSFIDTVTLGATFVLGFFVQGLLINSVGRKNIIGFGLLLSGAFGLSLIWIVEPRLLVANFILFVVFPGLDVSVLGGAVVDLVPTHLRGKAVCICFMLGRAGGFVGINLVGGLLESYCIETFAAISAFMLFCGSITFIIPI